MAVTNKTIFEWINKQAHWVITDTPMYTVVILEDDGEPVSKLTEDLEDAFRYAEKNKHKLMYFIRQVPDGWTP